MTSSEVKVTSKADTIGSKILIIDQNQSRIQQLSIQLKSKHYSISISLESNDGLLKAQQEIPDLILLNITMPDIDSFETYRKLKKQSETSNTPIILFGDSNDIQEHNTINHTRNFHYLALPTCKDEVLNKVKTCLHIRSLQTQLTRDILNQKPLEPQITKFEVPPVSTNKDYENTFYRMLVQTSPDAILIECEGRIIFTNQAATSLYHATSSDDLIGKPLISLTAQESRMSATIAFRELEHLNQIHTQEEKALLLDKQICDVSVTRLHFNYAGHPAIQMVVRDISEHKKLESQLHYQATHDSATGLPNRNLFTDRLLQAITYAKRQQNELLVCFVNLDHFKRVNNNLGHDIGDQLLICLANRMISCIRTTDTVARIGSDEFVLLLPCSGDKKSSLNVVERMLLEVSKPVTFNNRTFVVTCSIGYSHYPTDGDNAPDLLRFADKAMNHAKEMGRNTIKHYDPLLQALADENEKLEHALCRAITNNELSLQYQVQAELHHGHITGMEALLRWHNPELGFIPPARFISIAEQAGLIESITEWIVKTVCLQCKSWQQQGCDIVPIAVNISAVSLHDPQRLENLIIRNLETTQLDPTLLELEFTESASMDDPQTIIPLMLRLKTLGVRLAIDDFGTGYSNLHYLKQFPIDKLKLDGSFIREITTEPKSQAIADAIITMAHRLNLTIIAEMVETKEQLKVLYDNKCDQIQGYYLSKPLPADECTKLLNGYLMDLSYCQNKPKKSSL